MAENLAALLSRQPPLIQMTMTVEVLELTIHVYIYLVMVNKRQNKIARETSQWRVEHRIRMEVRALTRGRRRLNSKAAN